MNPARMIAETLRDGTEVVVGPLGPFALARLRDGFDRLSAQSKRQRFLGGVSRLTDRQLEYLAHPDQLDHLALGMCIVPPAGAPETGIGIARCVRAADAGDLADVAITVIDEWQARGAGTLLLQHLAARARTAGIHRWRATMFADNRGALALVERNFKVVARRSAGRGVVELTCSLARYSAAAGCFDGWLHRDAIGSSDDAASVDPLD